MKSSKKVLKAPRGEHVQPLYQEIGRESAPRKSEVSVADGKIGDERSSIEENMVDTPGLRHVNSNIEMLDEPSRAKDLTVSVGEEEESRESENSEKVDEDDSEENDLGENREEEQSEESEESEEEKQAIQSMKQELEPREEMKKLSDASFDESSFEQEELEQAQNVNFEENMHRLDEDEVLEDNKKTKKKKKRIKFKKNVKPNQQDMDVMMREKINKKEKVQTTKAKAKKSYHAYLEHPRMRHQPSLQSPKGNKKNEDLDPLGLSSRPKKNKF